MASVRDSSEVKLIGFEQGINLKTVEQLRNQTRARFQPLANSKVVVVDKSSKKPSVTLRVKDIPQDPGDGLYNLYIESFKGASHDIKIRVVSSYKAKTDLTVTNTVTKTLYDAGTGGTLHNKNFTLADTKGNFLTVTLKFGISRTTRNSSSSWDVSLAGVDNTSNATVRNGVAAKIYSALNQISSDKDLDISVSLNANVITITQNISGEIGNLANSGTLISSNFITLPSFSSGKNGLLRTLNTGNLKHPRDNNVFALGLRDEPGYYVGEPNAVPYNDNINCSIQKIKRITFDLNNIINYNSANSGVTSRIIQDDTLLLVQEVKNSTIESAIGKKIKQDGLNKSLPATGSFGLENWKLTSTKENDFVFHDVVTESKKFSLNSRSVRLELIFPDLSFYNSNSSFKMKFFHISYDTVNDFIPKEPTTETETNSNIDFFVVNGSDSDDPIRIVKGRNSTEVLINPYSGIYGNLNNINNVFTERLKEGLKRLSYSFGLNLELKDISKADNQYYIEVTENNERLSFFKAVAYDEIASAQEFKGSLYINLGSRYENFIEENKKFSIYDGENDKKLIELIPDSSVYGSYKDREIDPAHSIYKIGIKNISSTQDFKFRFFDAILLAVENNDVDLQPTLKNAYARIEVENGNDAHGTIAIHDRITIKSAKQVTKTYTIVHGGRGGSKAIQTGEVILEGSQYSEGLSVPSAHPSIGTVAINIKSNDKKRDVLEQLSKAINSKNGHNEGKANHVIDAGGVDVQKVPGKQHLHLKQQLFGEEGNNAITLNGFSIFTVIGFTGASRYISTRTIRLINSGVRGSPEFRSSLLNTQDLHEATSFYLRPENIYTLEDFTDASTAVELRDGNDKNSYYLRVNHDLEIRSYGLGQRTSDLKFYEDLSLNGPKQHKDGYNRTLDIDPVFYVRSDSNVRFPIQVNNLGSSLGFECDGVIEPLGIRDLMLGRVITEKSIKGISGELGGEYSYSSIRKESYEISNKINFEKSKNVAFFDNCPTMSDYVKGRYEIGVNFADPVEAAVRNNVFYSRAPGVIFKNDSRIQPYIDTEEVVFQTNPLNGNNPETNEIDILVLTLQEMNSNKKTMIVARDENLGGENFRRKAGFDYSSPHPGTDSIVFSGLRYV